MLAPIVADAGARGAAVFIDLTETHSPKARFQDA
jgi:hypothetical protein